MSYLSRELLIGLLFAILFLFVVFALGFFVFSRAQLSLALSLVLCFQIIFSVILGSVTPLLIDRFGHDPTIASVPLFTVSIEMLSISALFGFVSRFL